MTPKEKAQIIYKLYNELVEDHTRGVTLKPLAKQCALIAVDEILDTLIGIYDYDFEVKYPYWQEVKQEIEKL